jgi:hypothetical protein
MFLKGRLINTYSSEKLSRSHSATAWRICGRRSSQTRRLISRNSTTQLST